MLEQTWWDQVDRYFQNQSPRFPSTLLNAWYHHLVIYTYIYHNIGTSWTITATSQLFHHPKNAYYSALHKTGAQGM